LERAALKDLDMRISLVFLAAIAGLQVPGWAEAADRVEPSGGGFVDTNHPRVTKDYYVVREGQGDRCRIVTGDFGKNPEGTIGGAPYASKKYATAALKKFPECKGGEATELEGKKRGKK
jgi:hypothetical protein